MSHSLDGKETSLSVIANTLGNRADITLRALDALRDLNVFFVEDTREFKDLLRLHGIDFSQKKIFSYASHNMKEATIGALNWLRKGESVGMLSDRGTPAISDPGAVLVEAAREAGFPVIPLPGPSSVATLFSVSGLNEGRFVFYGFYPQKQKERDELFEKIERFGLPVCFFESPRRIQDSLKEIAARFPSARVLIGREMTKMFEEYRWIELADLDKVLPNLVDKGEFCFILEFRKPMADDSASEIEQAINLRLSPDKAWAREIATRHSLPVSQVYNALQKRRKDLDSE